ncbi:MAG: DUF4153 domain-containing protein [Gemmatimonadales bacterium]
MRATLSPRTRLGLTLAVTGLGLGVLGDQLLRAPWGLNLVLFVLALAAAGTWVVRRFQLPVSADAPWLGTSVVLCAAAFVRRDSPTLQALDLAVLVGLLALTALAVQGASVRLRGASAYLIATCSACGHASLGALRLLLGDIAWHEVEGGRRSRQLGAVGTGILLSVPLLLVFGGLFVSADAAFESLVMRVRVDLGSPGVHVLFTGVCAALVAGYLRGACLGNASVAAAGERATPPGLRFATTATVLGALDLLFLLFVALQTRWLFGGASLVEQATGLTLSQYARRGFFELVTAAALVLPILLVADWATRRETLREETSFRALAAVLVLLVGVLVVSALQRMLLYVQAFGLTELRLYTTAFMAWLAGVFGWLLWTVLRGARPRFAFGALVQALAVFAGLHLVNPDAMIVRVGVSRASAGAPFDAAYVAGSLSADAVPALLEALPHLRPTDRGEVAERLLTRWGAAATRGAAPSPQDWRSWNWAESRARAMVRARMWELIAASVERSR